MSNAPKVFVSHASEDKERFVLNFATRLRSRGIDAWLDKWEMLPGDSLVEKIFDEGLKEATAVIVVLSANSVGKKWVREELNASVVAKIARGTKIIPIVLDHCAVPEPLKATVWESIDNIEKYDKSFDRIVAAIYGQTMKPVLGLPPNYAQQSLVAISDFQAIDNLVLKLSCEYLIEENDHVVDPNRVFVLERGVDVPQQEVLDAIEVLGGQGVLHVTHHSGSDEDRFNCYYQVNPSGMERYAEAYVSDYNLFKSDVIALIVNERIDSGEALQMRFGRPRRLVDHVLLWLEQRSLIKLEKFIGGELLISHVTVALRRSMDV